MEAHMGWNRSGLQDDPTGWLGMAPGLDPQAPGVQDLCASITGGCRTPRDQALAIFHWVQDLPFVVLDARDRNDPSLLASRTCGDSYTKAALMVHLLRHCQIPARMRWVQMRAASLTQGLWDFLKHTDVPFFAPMTEVWLGDRWRCTDAYVFDLPLAKAVRSHLLERGWRSGFLMHVEGEQYWDGSTDAYLRFAGTDPESWPISDQGCFHSHADFLLRAEMPVREIVLTHMVYVRQLRLMNDALGALREGRAIPGQTLMPPDTSSTAPLT
jgi:hypothetical protein